MKDLITLLGQRLPLYLPQQSGTRRSIGRAAVVILLQEYCGHTRLLMIRRATREGDPWSGQMGFTGGRREPTDNSDLAWIYGCGVPRLENYLKLIQVGEMTGHKYW